MATVEIETGKHIKRFEFWSPSTWAIPKLYWDAFSQEQRIHAICRQLEKVIKYADYIGVNVDDIAQRLQDIEDGKLDEFIVSAIEAWFAEHEPLIIEAIEELQTDLANEILNREAAISELRETVEGVMRIVEIDGINTVNENVYNYTPTVLLADGKSIMFDTGYIGDESIIETHLNELKIDKLDVLVITHYHDDHASNYAYIMQTWCDGDTKIYVQMAPTTANDQYNNWLTYDTNVKALANTLGLTVETPTDGETLSFGNVDLTFYNTNLSYRYDYDNISWANNGNYLTRTSTLNNYSLICLVKYGMNSYLETGDVEGMAQKFNASKINHVNVMRSPHHLVNKNGFEEFYDRACPDVYIASGNLEYTYNIADFRSSYLYRYLIYNQVNTSIYVNFDYDVDITLKSGQLESVTGFYMNKNFNPNIEGSTFLNMYSVFPPNMYLECPYQPYYTKIEDLWTIMRYMQGCPSWIIDTGVNSTSAILSGSPLVQEIKDVFNTIGYNVSNARVMLEFTNDRPVIKTSTRDYNATAFEVSQAWTTENPVYSFVPLHNKQLIYHAFDPAINDNENISTQLGDNFGFLMKANMIIATIDVNGSPTPITLLRKSADNNANVLFEGSHFTTSGVVQTVTISSTGLVRIFRFSFAGDTSVTNPYMLTKLETVF